MDSLESKIDDSVREFLRLLGRYADNKEPLDLGRKVQYFTLDVISNISYGGPFGFVETDSDVYEYISTMEQNMPTIIVTTVLPWMMPILASPLLKFMLPSDTDKIGLGRTMR